jgi:hypothetical protein
MKPGLLQPAALVRVSDDATTTICEPARALDVVHRVPVLVVGKSTCRSRLAAPGR